MLNWLARLFSMRANQVAAVVPSNEPVEAAKIPEVGSVKVAHTFFPGYPHKLVRADLKNSLVEDLNAHKRVLENCDFSYSVFRRGYFRETVFRNCVFKGVRFEDCSFRGAEFYQCDFTYAVFQSSLVAAKSIIPSLPLQPNQRRELLQILRANAASMGDHEGQSLYILQELDASKAHHKGIVDGKDEFYRNKYVLGDRISSWFHLQFLRLDSLVWGHGERPIALMRTTVAIVVSLALINAFSPGVRTSATAFEKICSSLNYSIRFFLDLPLPAGYVGFEPIDYALIILRYVSFGLLISTLYKYLSHR